MERYNLKWDLKTHLKTGWVYSGGHAIILVVHSINGGNNGFCFVMYIEEVK